MRHGKKVNKLGRTHSHRAAMLSNMAASLLISKRINTTVAKAKALRGYVEPLITRSKDDSTHSRRVVFSYLQNKIAVTELFREIAPKVSNRPGGYTRIIKTGNRLGDNAEMCMMELVDFNELLLDAKEAKKARTTRRGRKKGGAVVDETAMVEVAASEEKAIEENSETKTDNAVSEGAPQADSVSGRTAQKKGLWGRKKKEDKKEE
jgi:large subunit ribosomal protein L17